MNYYHLYEIWYVLKNQSMYIENLSILCGKVTINSHNKLRDIFIKRI